MKIPKKMPKSNYLFFNFFLIFLFFLFLPNISFAYCPPIPLAQSEYFTECGERVIIGDSYSNCCNCKCAAVDPQTKECVSWDCAESCTQYSCRGAWQEYKANTLGCNSMIMTRTCRSVCGPATACCSCGPCQAQCDPWRICEECGSWQKAERGCLVTKAGLARPECKCNKDCINKPTGPRYYDNPNYPANHCRPEPSLNRNDIRLPVKLNWDNVKGWRDGWREGNTCPKTCSANCPDCPGAVDCYEKAQCVQSYVLKITQKAVVIDEKIIEEEKTLIDGQILNKSEYNILKEKGPCFLKSNRAYQWQVRACCGVNGTNCGEWSEPWEFTTNTAPEPISPLDPDWLGQDFIKNQPLEVGLRWCDVIFQRKIGEEIREEKPKSFKLFFYLGRYEPNKEEVIIRHPWTNDHPKILSDIRFPEPQPRLLNERHRYFTKPPILHLGAKYNFYAWEIAACERFDGRGKCTNFSQKWRFSLDENIKLETPELISPPNNIEIPVGFPVPFEWNPVLGGKSYILEIKKGGTLIERKVISGTKEIIDHPKLLLNTIYQWRVNVCWNFEGTQCESDWSPIYSFKTTGQAPIPVAPKGADIIIPTDFQWEKVPGAKSYLFKIQGPEIDLTKTVDDVVERPKISLGFPSLRQEKTYSWQIKTCADTAGRICGNWSSPQTFTTFKLGAPVNPFPESNKEIHTYQMPKTFSWDPVLGAKYYKLAVNYIRAPEEKDAENCPEGKIKEKIISDNSELITFHCLGNYQWQTQACLDENCREAGKPAIWNFVLSAKEAPQEFRGGLVPCNRDFDDPNTGWNETKPCGIEHIFLLLQRIINFALWTIAPLALVLLTVYTGAMFYFSLSTGTFGTLTRVKSLWKAAGIGFGIIFFSWTIINLLLGILGFQVDIFGRWYEIPI